MNPKHPKIRKKIQVFSRWHHFLAFGFGSGLSPWAPGTMGTVAAIPLYLIMALWLPTLAYILITLLFAVYGVYICEKTSRDLQVHDFSGIVWDEIVGFLLSMAFLPLHWVWILAGFILFRLLDIIKPWPISYIDKNISGGLGIMLDDILAGLLTCMILNLSL